MVTVVGSGKDAVDGSTESTEVFDDCDDEVGGGGRRPLSQHSRNAASQCGPNRTISEQGNPAS